MKNNKRKMKIDVIYNGAGYYATCNGQKITKTYATMDNLRKYGNKKLVEYVKFWENI